MRPKLFGLVFVLRSSDVFPSDREERSEELQTAVNKIFEKDPPAGAR